MSLLTGYAFATAIIGAAVFIDRVRYAGPSEQQLALGSLAGAMAIGALGSGYLVRPMGVMLPSLAGLIAEIVGLLLVATISARSAARLLCGGLALFGLGFGVTVTSRTTGVLEALGAKRVRRGQRLADRGAHARHGHRRQRADRPRHQIGSRPCPWC